MSLQDGKQSDKQIQIKFVTKDSNISIPGYPFSVPVSVSSNELNDLINHVLKDSSESWSKQEFSFLINNEYLQTSLEVYFNEKNLSTETTIEIEYVIKQSCPKPFLNLPHNDWVSSVQIFDKWILSGSYDHSIHVWTIEGNHLSSIPGHIKAVKAVKWIERKEESLYFVSASQDQVSLIWKWNPSKNAVECIWICRGHEGSVDCLGIHSSGEYFATGSWDSTLKIWSIADEEKINNKNEENYKKLKKEKGESKIKAPVCSLSGHKEGISSVVWMHDNDIATASWDHLIKIWDIEVEGMKSEIAGNKAFFSLDWSRHNNLFVTSSADHHIRLYDPKSHEGQIAKLICTDTQTLHQWVTCVKWSKNDEHFFLSGGNDKRMKMWDIRSYKVPLYSMYGHEDRILCCDWSCPEFLISGGCDSTVKIFQIPISVKN